MRFSWRRAPLASERGGGGVREAVINPRAPTRLIEAGVVASTITRP